MSTKKTVEIGGIEYVVQEEQVLKFQERIESLVSSGLSYLESIQEYCELDNVEVDTVKSLISPNLMSKLIDEARERNLLERGEQNSTTLPVT